MSPKTEKRGLTLPITPAQTGPVFIPTRSSVGCQEQIFLFSRLDLHRTSPDCGERHCISRTRKRRFDPTLELPITPSHTGRVFTPARSSIRCREAIK